MNRYDTTNDILAVKWVDNSVCAVLTNFDFVEPIQSVNRWSKDAKKKVPVPQTKLYATYNAHMGGVDNMDQNLSCYRICIKGKKWWWVIFTYLLDLVIVNAWKLGNLPKQQTESQLNFRRAIVRKILMEARGEATKKKRNPASNVEAPKVKHVPMKLPSQAK